MKTTLLTLGLVLALAAPAFADGPSIPVWSGAPIATPGDGGLFQMNPTSQNPSHVNCHGVHVSDGRVRNG